MTERPLILKRASASRSSGEWCDDDYDVLENGVVVGRISKEQAAPQGRPWIWASGPSADSVKRAAIDMPIRGERVVAKDRQCGANLLLDR